MKSNKRGSALILVIISLLILSLIGIAGLTTIGTDLSTARNYVDDKTAFYIADGGIEHGLNLVRAELYPPNISFRVVSGSTEFKSGGLQYSTEQPVSAFTGFKLPPPLGMSVEVGSETGAVTNPWQLTVSSKVKKYTDEARGASRKEVTVIFQALSAEY